MGEPTPIFAREMAVRLHNQNYLQVEISKITGIPRSTVDDIISKYKRGGHVTPSVSSGRPPKVSICSKLCYSRSKIADLYKTIPNRIIAVIITRETRY